MHISKRQPLTFLPLKRGGLSRGRLFGGPRRKEGIEGGAKFSNVRMGQTAGVQRRIDPSLWLTGAAAALVPLKTCTFHQASRDDLSEPKPSLFKGGNGVEPPPATPFPTVEYSL